MMYIEILNILQKKTIYYIYDIIVLVCKNSNNMRGIVMAGFNEDTRVKIPATIQYLKLGDKYQS